MPVFRIIPCDTAVPHTEVIAVQPSEILQHIEHLACNTANVVCDDAHAFSVRRSESGLWVLSKAPIKPSSSTPPAS